VNVCTSTHTAGGRLNVGDLVQQAVRSRTIRSALVDVAYDELTRPPIVYWSEALNGKGKPESATIDVDRINSLVPVLVEDYRQAPEASYGTKMKQEFKKTF
jgi:hypothetical protein